MKQLALLAGWIDWCRTITTWSPGKYHVGLCGQEFCVLEHEMGVAILEQLLQ